MPGSTSSSANSEAMPPAVLRMTKPNATARTAINVR